MIKKIKEAYERGGLSAVRKYLQGAGINKLKAAIEWTGRQVTLARRDARDAAKEFKIATEVLRDRTKKRNHAQADAKRTQKEINNEDNPERKRRLEQRVKELRNEAEKLTRQIRDIKRRRRRVLDRRFNMLDRANAFVRYRVINRKKLAEARKKAQQEPKGQPEFEPYMANGYNWQDSNQFVRDWVARIVVLDGNYVTSLARDFVPPGGSTTSFHLKGMAGDGGTSAKSQQREYERGLGNPNYYELFGPNNYQCLRYGQQSVQSEGSGNEQLHDSHQHCAGSYS